MSTEQNKAAARRICEEVFSQGNLDAIDELVAPDAVDHEGFGGLDTQGAAGARRLVAATRAAFPDLRVTIDDLIAEGDKVALRLTLSGTHQGALAGVPASGKRVTFTSLDLYRFADGKLVEHWGQFDTQGLMRQLQAGGAPA